MDHVKTFETLTECREFSSGLPPCRITRVTARAGGFTLEWTRMKLRMIRNNGQVIVGAPTQTVINETDHSYYVRGETGGMIKVNRHTMMSGVKMFEAA